MITADAMDCTEFLARYSDYDDSLLDVSELHRFRGHLSQCDSCSRYDRVLRKGRMLARQAPRLPPDESFAPRLNQRLWQTRTRRRAGFIGVPGGAATALAGVTVVVCSLWAVTLMDQGVTLAGSAEAEIPVVDLPPQHAAGPERVFARKALPPASTAPPRHWTDRRVDQPVPVTYSPLVTGPPTYRAPGAVHTSALISTAH
jgi:hypothetical protein